jgi:hypothetical protein
MGMIGRDSRPPKVTERDQRADSEWSASAVRFVGGIWCLLSVAKVASTKLRVNGIRRTPFSSELDLTIQSQGRRRHHRVTPDG